MVEGMRIRQPGKKDKEKLMSLVRLLYKDDPNEIEIWEKGYENYLSYTYIAVKDNNIVGYISIEGNDNETLLIGDLFVLPEFREKGIAGKFITLTIKRAVKGGKKYVRAIPIKIMRNLKDCIKNLVFPKSEKLKKGFIFLRKYLEIKEPPFGSELFRNLPMRFQLLLNPISGFEPA